ncbi:hypothetical protein [Singulisphaera acidiphila]|nr:hypothetical protein [Singulisphaera acidiphila]
MVSDIFDVFSLIAHQDGTRGDPPAMMAPARFPYEGKPGPGRPH